MKKLFLTLAIFISFNCYAVSNVYVLFINGVNTDEDQARLNLARLIKYSNIVSNMITWNILYNETHSLIFSDVWDVLYQKIYQNKQFTLDDYVTIYMKRNNLNYAPGSKEYEEIKSNIANYFLNGNTMEGKNLQKIIDQFHNIVKDYNNSYVLLISHSQGNLYANELYKY